METKDKYLVVIVYNDNETSAWPFKTAMEALDFYNTHLADWYDEMYLAEIDGSTIKHKHS
jgi:hypothetical protein